MAWLAVLLANPWFVSERRLLAANSMSTRHVREPACGLCQDSGAAAIISRPRFSPQCVAYRSLALWSCSAPSSRAQVSLHTEETPRFSTEALQPTERPMSRAPLRAAASDPVLARSDVFLSLGRLLRGQLRSLCGTFFSRRALAPLGVLRSSLTPPASRPFRVIVAADGWRHQHPGESPSRCV